MTGSRSLLLVRSGFLLSVVVFVWLGLRDRRDDVAAVLGASSPVGVLVALALVLLGLLATGALWLRLMSSLGAPLPLRRGLATFYVGQLGKYIPGSLWSIGAQAQMAGRRAVPPRVTVAAGLLFLVYHVATAVVAGAGAALLGGLEPPWPAWVSVLLLLAGSVGLLPASVRRLGRRIAGRPVRIGVVDTAVALALMAATWTAYSTALVLLVPGAPWLEIAALGGTFGLAYVVGVVVVIAPAGVGARETFFVLLLTPQLGLGGAAALALMARVVHTVADATMALGWWSAARWVRASPNRDGGPRARTTRPSMLGRPGG